MKLKHCYALERLQKIQDFLMSATSQPTIWNGKEYTTPWKFLEATGNSQTLLDELKQLIVEIGAERVLQVYFYANTDPFSHVKQVANSLPVHDLYRIRVFGESDTLPVVWVDEEPLPASNLEWETQQSQLTVVVTNASVKLFYYYQTKYYYYETK